MKPVPEKGTVYPIFDDGKITETRRYYGSVLRVIDFESAETVTVKHLELVEPDKSTSTEAGDKYNYKLVDRCLVDVWREKVLTDGIFADTTDWFVEVYSEEFDDNNLWFVRTKDGGWFSLDLQSSWQGCELDVDGKMNEELDRIIEEDEERD